MSAGLAERLRRFHGTRTTIIGPTPTIRWPTMSVSGTPQSPAHEFAPTTRPWRDEFRALMRLGVPMAITQLVQFSIMTIDVLMVARLGEDHLAAASLGLVVLIFIFMIGFGPAMAISPIASQALGKNPNDVEGVRRSVHMGLAAILAITPIGLGVALAAEPIAHALGQPPVAASLAAPYILVLIFGLPFNLAALLLRNFLATLDRTIAPLMIIAVTTALNALLNWLLIFGALGFPQLDLVGAGIASSCAQAAMFFGLLAYCAFDKRARRFRLHRPPFVFSRARFAEVLRLAWPISLTTMFEGMLFNAAILVVGRIGVTEMAAFQIALNVAALAFMVPFGFSMGGATRVGLAAGAGDLPGVRRAAVVTMAASGLIMVVFALIVGFAPGAIAGLYVSAREADDIQLLGVVAGFLRIAAFFMVFDGLQVAANQCLRGLKDVRVPMVVTGISYWVVAFPLAAGLGLLTPLGANGVWWGLLVGLGAAAAMLSTRLTLLIRQSRLTPAEG